MKKKIFKNLGLKILAILSALAVWWVVMNIDDPLVKTTLSGIQVELRNTEALTDKGYIYEVVSGSTISVTVSAPESVAKELKASDFSAYADLSQLSPLTDSASIVVEYNKSDSKSQIVDISSRTQVVKLRIDNKETADIPVSIVIVGAPATDYVVGDTYASQTKLQVTGAAATVDSIAYAEISYDVSDMTSSVNEKVTPVFYNEKGVRVDTSGLELSRTSLTLSIEILPTKWVNVNVTPSGTVADGYKMTGYTQNIQQVKIAGSRESLAALNSLDIPADAVVMDNIGESSDYTVVIANYLSGVYSIVSDTKELVVHVEVEPLITKSFKITAEGIRINNLADKLKAEILDDSIEIKISAISEVLENFNLDALNVSIDLQGVGTGEYNDIIVNMSENDNFSVLGTYTVAVKVYNPDEETQPETQEETSANAKKK